MRMSREYNVFVVIINYSLKHYMVLLNKHFSDSFHAPFYDSDRTYFDPCDSP